MTDQLEMIDIHAHILPGIDDGARNWEETGRLLEAAWAQGVRHIIATPHFSRKTDMEQLRQLKAGVRELAHRKGLELEISLGQELRYFEELPLYLEQGRALTLAESRYALVEFKPGDGFQTIRRQSGNWSSTDLFPYWLTQSGIFAFVKQAGPRSWFRAEPVCRSMQKA